MAKTQKHILVLSLIVIVLSLTYLLSGLIMASSVDSFDASITAIDAQAAFTLLQDNPDIIILDIRTPDEYNLQRIPNSIIIDYYSPQFRAQLDALEKDKTYFVYCRSGNRSGDSLRHFQDLGFRTIYHLEGGILSWVRAGLPTI